MTDHERVREAGDLMGKRLNEGADPGAEVEGHALMEDPVEGVRYLQDDEPDVEGHLLGPSSAERVRQDVRRVR